MKRCRIVTGPDDLAGLSDHDRAELERFIDYLRRCAAAKKAGVPHPETCRAIYHDVYPEDDAPPSERKR
jgi:hypothetical protein